MASFRDRRPSESPVPRRRPRSPAEEVALEEGMDFGSEAASRFEPVGRNTSYVPIAYPVAEVAPAAGGGTAAHRVDDGFSGDGSDEEPEMSEFAESQFMNSEFNDSHLGTEYSTYGTSELSGQEGDAGGGGSRFVGTTEWARQQRSQNSSQFTADRDGGSSAGPWSGPGRQTSGWDKDGGGRQHRGRGKYAGEDGRMHDLPPMPDKKQMPSNHSVLSHDLSGFSDFDPTPKSTHRHQRDASESVGSGGSGGAAGDITAPHPAPSDRINWNRGLTGAAAAAADADARNLARKQQQEREAAAADLAQKRAAKKAELSAGAGGAAAAGATVAGGSDSSGSGRKKPRPPAAHSGPPDPRKGEANGAAVRDMGDMKEEGSGSGMSAFRASTLEAQRTHGDPFDDRPRNENGTTGEYAVPTYRSLIFTPLMFLICLILLFWEFGLNGWAAESLEENPSYGPSVETLIEAGAKRTDLIVDNGDWWRLISPMFLHAGVVHFLFNMLGFLQVGGMVERVFGWWRVACIYLVAGVFGTIVSAIFVPTQVMVGASGAIFGVFGALWADLWQNWSVNQDRCRMFTVLFILTAVNIILGLMPFLDNFAHCGGMLMGLFMGLGLLVQKREDDRGDRLDKKCYQVSLQLVAAVAVPTLMILGLSLLYGRSDPAEWCDWCENISCVEFPPGDSPWWACDECSTVGFEAEKFSDGTITISCPDGTSASSDQCSDESDESLVACCISLCL
ncbi:unnamed protein product [Ectocarpus sp. 12 AP-2014]